MLLGLFIGARSTVAVPPESRSRANRCAELKLGCQELPPGSREWPSGENEKARVKLTDSMSAIRMENTTTDLPPTRPGFKVDSGPATSRAVRRSVDTERKSTTDCWGTIPSPPAEVRCRIS